METKVCTKCGRELPLTEFYKGASDCKLCRKTSAQARKNIAYCTIPIKSTVYFQKCSKCNKVKNISEFYKQKSKASGVGSHCIECQKMQQKAKYLLKEKNVCYIKITHPVFFKKCSSCGSLKHVSNFNRTKNTQHGYRCQCNDCRRKYYLENDFDKRGCKVCHIKITCPVYFKICTQCGKMLHIDNFSNGGKNQINRAEKCRKCTSENYKDKYRDELIIKRKNNKTKISNETLQKSREYYKIYKSKYPERLAKSRANAREKHIERIKKKGMYDRLFLSDSYIKGNLYRIYGIDTKDIPNEVICLYRTMIMSKRELNNHKTA